VQLNQNQENHHEDIVMKKTLRLIPAHLIPAQIFKLLIFVLSIGWTNNVLATPPTPPAQITLPDKLSGDVVRLKEKLLPVQIKVNEEIAELEIVATQQPLVAGKSDFEQPAAEIILQKRQEGKQERQTGHQLQLKMEQPGSYLINIRIIGKTASGNGFSDRLMRYVIIEKDGTANMISPNEYQRRDDKAREQLFLNENRKNPKNHPIRLLFEDTAKVPEAARQNIKSFDMPGNQQLEVRPQGPSEFLRKHSIDHSASSWTSHDPVTVRGRVVFQDIDGVWRPLVNVSINLWDSDFLIDEHLGSVATDWNGRWSFTVNDDDGWFQNGRDIYYTFKLENTRLSTGSCGFLTGAYEWKSAVHNDLADGTVLDFGDETATTNTNALQVWSTLNLAWNHAVVVGGWDPGKIDSCYPASATLYNGKVNVAATDNDGPDSITHEYGHGLMAHAYAGGDPSPGGAHGFGDCNQNRSLSWSEGWATGFMLSVRPDNRYNWHQGDTGQELEAFSSTCHTGETSEGWVSAALLDMMDAHDDDNGGSLNRGRNGVSDHNTGNTVALATILRDTMVGNHHNDVLEFWNGLSGELDATRRNLANEIMRYNWMTLAAPPTSCVATKVATLNEKNPEPLLAGLRKFRDLTLKNWSHGRELINMYYRNSPEIALILLRNPKQVPDALRVMNHFSSMGAMVGNHEAYLNAMQHNQMVMPPEIYQSADRLFIVLSESGSPELKRDVARVKTDFTELKGLSLLQLQDRVTKTKVREANKAPLAINQNKFSPASAKALNDQKLQEAIKAISEK
jgi:hypothetical protein